MNDNNMEKLIAALMNWRGQHGLDKESEIEDMNKADKEFMKIISKFTKHTPAAVPSKLQDKIDKAILLARQGIMPCKKAGKTCSVCPTTICTTRTYAYLGSVHSKSEAIPREFLEDCQRLRNGQIDEKTLWERYYPTFVPSKSADRPSLTELCDMIQDGVNKDHACIKIADDILSHYRLSVPSKSEGGLREELKELIKNPKEKLVDDPKIDDKTYAYWAGQNGVYDMFYDKITAILSRHPTPPDEIEPLAVLADRKGCSVEYTGPAFYADEGNPWEVAVVLPSIGDCHSFEDRTMKAAEDKARKYLSSLPDVKEGK